ncbi:MAG: hypothetical protein AAF518_06420 [Spirochaetota bacterium]
MAKFSYMGIYEVRCRPVVFAVLLVFAFLCQACKPSFEDVQKTSPIYLKQLTNIPQEKGLQVSKLQFFPKKKLLIAASKYKKGTRGVLRFFDYETEKVIREYKGYVTDFRLAIGQQKVYAVSYKTLLKIDYRVQKVSKRPLKTPAFHLALSPDERLLAVSHSWAKHYINLYDSETLSLYASLKKPSELSYPKKLYFSKRQNYLAVAASGYSFVWKLARPNVVSSFSHTYYSKGSTGTQKNSPALNAVLIDSKEQFLLTATARNINTWQIATKKKVQSWRSRGSSIKEVVFWDSQDYLLVATRESIELWERSGSRLIYGKNAEKPIAQLAVHPAQKIIAVAYDDASISILQITDSSQK